MANTTQPGEPSLRGQATSADDGAPVRVPTAHPLTVGELESLAWRLRVGGATDDTAVRLGYGYAEACVLAPDMVLESTPAEAPVDTLPPWLAGRTVRLAIVVLALALGYLAIGVALL